MNRQLQWRVMVGAVFLILFSVGATLFAEPVVRPIIDRPGGCLYCQAVKEAFAQAQQSIDLWLFRRMADHVSSASCRILR